MYQVLKSSLLPMNTFRWVYWLVFAHGFQLWRTSIINSSAHNFHGDFIQARSSTAEEDVQLTSKAKSSCPFACWAIRPLEWMGIVLWTHNMPCPVCGATASESASQAVGNHPTLRTENPGTAVYLKKTTKNIWPIQESLLQRNQVHGLHLSIVPHWNPENVLRKPNWLFYTKQ